MGKIDSEVVNDLPEIEAGKSYRVIGAEVGPTEVKQYNAVAVYCERVPDGVEHNTMLWVQKKVGERTKLGTFLKVLGDDTDKWKGKVFEVVKWGEKDREIKLVK